MPMPPRLAPWRNSAISADPVKAPIITARALAALDQLLNWAEPYLMPETVCLFLKGAKAEDELTLASRSWNMAATRHGSLTDPSGVILKLSGIERRGQQ